MDTLYYILKFHKPYKILLVHEKVSQGITVPMLKDVSYLCF